MVTFLEMNFFPLIYARQLNLNNVGQNPTTSNILLSGENPTHEFYRGQNPTPLIFVGFCPSSKFKHFKNNMKLSIKGDV